MHAPRETEFRSLMVVDAVIVMRWRRHRTLTNFYVKDPTYADCKTNRRLRILVGLLDWYSTVTDNVTPRVLRRKV